MVWNSGDRKVDPRYWRVKKCRGTYVAKRAKANKRKTCGVINDVCKYFMAEREREKREREIEERAETSKQALLKGCYCCCCYTNFECPSNGFWYT